MKVSLKEARRIERRIQEKGLRKGYPLRAKVNIFSSVPVEEAIEYEAERVKECVELHADLIKTRSSIRRQIQVTNETSGINELIAQREEHIRLLSLWEDILETADDMEDATIVARTVENKRDRAENGKEDHYGSRPNTVDFIAVTDDLFAYSGEESRACQRAIDNCDDKLAALNATTKIELSDEMVTLLSTQKII